MRVFLRNKKTRLYYAGPAGWGATAEKAHGFTSVPQATKVAFDEKMPEAEIVLSFALFADEVVVPVLHGYRDFDYGNSADA